jgi:hypothetical protein
MRPAPAALRGCEVRNAATNGTTFSGLDRAMRWPGPAKEEPQSPDTRHSLHITLREGFRGHTVVIVVDGEEVYRRSGVTTDPRIPLTDAVELVVGRHLVQVMVSVTPGDYHASLDLVVSAYPHLAISLVGEGTVSFETSARRFT